MTRRSFLKQYATESFDELPYSRVTGEEVYHLADEYIRESTQVVNDERIVRELEIQHRLAERHEAAGGLTSLESMIYQSSRRMALTALNLNSMIRPEIGVESISVAIEEDKSFLKKIKDALVAAFNRLVSMARNFFNRIISFFGGLSKKAKKVADDIKEEETKADDGPNASASDDSKVRKERRKTAIGLFIQKAVRLPGYERGCISVNGFTQIDVVAKAYADFAKSITSKYALRDYSSLIADSGKLSQFVADYKKQLLTFSIEIGMFKYSAVEEGNHVKIDEGTVNAVDNFTMSPTEYADFLQRHVSKAGKIMEDAGKLPQGEITNALAALVKAVGKSEDPESLKQTNSELKSLYADTLAIMTKVSKTIAGVCGAFIKLGERVSGKKGDDKK